MGREEATAQAKAAQREKETAAHAKKVERKARTLCHVSFVMCHVWCVEAVGCCVAMSSSQMCLAHALHNTCAAAPVTQDKTWAVGAKDTSKADESSQSAEEAAARKAAAAAQVGSCRVLTA